LRRHLIGLNKPFFCGQHSRGLGSNPFPKLEHYIPNNFQLVRSYFNMVQVWSEVTS